MEWLSENWVFLLIAIAYIALHLPLFGHGGHGHGGHGSRRDEQAGRDGHRVQSDGHRH